MEECSYEPDIRTRDAMQTDTGWSWDASTSTLSPREVEEPDASRRGSAESAVHDFAAFAATVADAGALRDELAAAAGRVAGGLPTVVTLNPDGGAATLAPGFDAIPLRAGGGGRSWGKIVLGARGLDGPPAAGTARRRLETLATLAGLALDRLRAARPAAATGSALQGEGLLGAVLPFALGQARRHKEPLSLLVVAIDRLRAVRDLLGDAEADRAVNRVGARITGLIRASDLVARLEGDRLMAILPRSELHDARRVAEKLCRGVAAADDLLGAPLPASISVGVASFPSCASTLGELLDAAEAALDDARRLGRGRVAVAPAVEDSWDRDAGFHG